MDVKVQGCGGLFVAVKKTSKYQPHQGVGEKFRRVRRRAIQSRKETNEKIPSICSIDSFNRV